MPSNPNMEAVPARNGGQPFVFVTLHSWAPNGPSVQSDPMTPDEARAFALDVLNAADAATDGGR